MDQTSGPSHRRLYSISEEITLVDDQILHHGGTSSNLKRLPSRLQQSKRSLIDSRQQIEDLVYEVSYLKGELQWHKESKQALLQLKEQMFEIFHIVEDALVQITARLEESERRYLGLWGLPGKTENDGGVI